MTAGVAVDLSRPSGFVPHPPHAVWAAMRKEARLPWQDRAEAPGFFSVTRHDQARAVLRDPGLFSSEWGMTLDSTLGARDPAAGLMIEVTDPPRHARLRKLVTAVVTPRFAEGLRSVISAHAQELVAAALVNGTVEAVSALAAPMPRLTIGSILGLPIEDQQVMTDLVTRAITGCDETGSDTPAERRRTSETANNELLLFFVERTERPAAVAPGGLVRRLLEVELEGVRLTPDEVVLNCLNLAIGGYETTRTAIAAGLELLCALPHTWERVRADPSLVDPFTEEVLRHATPAMHLTRTATRDTALGGTALSEGDTVCVWLAAANRDPAVFDAPDTFSLDRAHNPHLAFTVGAHFCLGAVLARMELRALFTELATRAGPPRALSALRRRPSTFIAAADSLWLDLKPRR